MKDGFIDIPEIQRNGGYFITAARSWLFVHPAMMQELIDAETEIQGRIDAGLKATGDTRSSNKASLKAQRELVAAARAALITLYETLYPMRSKGTFELTRFYPTGRKKDIGSSVADVQKNLKDVCDGFEMYPSIAGTEELKTQVRDLRAQLEATAEAATGSGTTKRLSSNDWRALRAEWKRRYYGAQEIVRGLFRRAGRLEDWKSLFLDFQASGNGSASAGEAGTSGGSGNAAGSASPA